MQSNSCAQIDKEIDKEILLFFILESRYHLCTIRLLLNFPVENWDEPILNRFSKCLTSFMTSLKERGRY